MLLDPTGRHVIVTTPETVDIYDATGTNKVDKQCCRVFRQEETDSSIHTVSSMPETACTQAGCLSCRLMAQQRMPLTAAPFLQLPACSCARCRPPAQCSPLSALPATTSSPAASQ